MKGPHWSKAGEICTSKKKKKYEQITTHQIGKTIDPFIQMNEEIGSLIRGYLQSVKVFQTRKFLIYKVEKNN